MPADRRLAALAAAMAPAVAGRLLCRLSGGGAAAAAASRLAVESRGVRLAALAEALGRDPPPPWEELRAAAASERPGLAAALRAFALAGMAGEPEGRRTPLEPLVARLCLERLESLPRPR